MTTSLLVRVDARARQPMQEQIYDGVRRAILEGVLAPGAHVPSSRALAADLGVSRTTTLCALQKLEAEGYLAARRGSGTRVAEELPDDLARQKEGRRRPRTDHPRLSTRGQTLARAPQGAHRLDGPPRAFRIGTPALDLFPVELWWRLANRRRRSVGAAQLDYGHPAGLRALREAIADHVQTARGTRCDADQVVIVAGAQQGFELTCRLLLDPGDTAWMEDPGYPGARSALLSAGARIVPIPVDDDGLDVARGRRRAGGARLVYVTPSHQYPLGVPMSLPRRLALLAWARAARAWVIEDDYDSEFRHGARPIPCLHGLDADGRVIYVGTFAKTLFPSLRLGFLVVPPDLVDEFVAARAAADQHPPALDQAVLADFIAGGHFARHLRRMRLAYRERLEAVAAAAARVGALSLRPVSTGLHAVADLDGAGAERVTAEAAARGVETVALSSYFAGAGAPNALVLGFGAVRPEAARRGMERLAAAIRAARR